MSHPDKARSPEGSFTSIINALTKQAQSRGLTEEQLMAIQSYQVPNRVYNTHLEQVSGIPMSRTVFGVIDAASTVINDLSGIPHRTASIYNLFATRRLTYSFPDGRQGNLQLPIPNSLSDSPYYNKIGYKENIIMAYVEITTARILEHPEVYNMTVPHRDRLLTVIAQCEKLAGDETIATDIPSFILDDKMKTYTQTWLEDHERNQLKKPEKIL